MIFCAEKRAFWLVICEKKGSEEVELYNQTKCHRDLRRKKAVKFDVSS